MSLLSSKSIKNAGPFLNGSPARVIMNSSPERPLEDKEGFMEVKEAILRRRAFFENRFRSESEDKLKSTGGKS